MRSCDILQQCNDLKDRVIVNDEINWEIRNKLQQLLERALLNDVDYGLSKQAEQLLWNCCFKSCIDFYQGKLRERKTEDNVAFLNMFLTSSIGFFTQLLSKLCRYYQLNLNNNCIKSDSYLGILNGHWDKPRRATKTNSLYIVQFCLIHLGDIARYQKRLNVAETFYLNACRVCQTNGHPFNQLAILETSRSRNLSAIYLYTRSLYVENPFMLASTNLDKFYSTVDLKLSTQSYVDKFFKFMSVIHQMIPQDLSLAECELITTVCTDLKQAILSDAISADDLLHIFIIAIGSVWKINPSKETNSLSRESLNANENGMGFSNDEKRCLKLLIEYIQKFFVTLIQICSLEKDRDEKLGGIIQLCTYWFKIYSNLIIFNEFVGEKSRLLPVLAKYLNFGQNSSVNEQNKEISNVVLPEEREMFGFLPLDSVLQSVDFETSQSTDNKLFTMIRHQRLTEFGKFIVNLVKNEDLFCINEKIMDNCEKITEFSSKIVIEDVPEPKKVLVEEKSVKFKEEIVEDKIGVEHAKTSKRQTKVLPLLTIFEKERVKDEGGDKENQKTSEQPKIKIAPPGSKVELPLAPEKKEKEEKPDTGEDAMTSQQQQQEKSRYELPPRFQAAKLKHALSGGGGAPSFSNFDRRLPDGSLANYMDARMPNLSMAAFPPLVPPNWAAGAGPQGIMGPPPSEFHKTPGVRPRGPPPFPQGPNFTATPPPGYSIPPPPPPSSTVPNLSRPPPMPFTFGGPKQQESAATSNRPPGPRGGGGGNMMWSQNSLFMNSDDHYFNMWQPKSLNSVPPVSPPNRNEEMWKNKFDWANSRHNLPLNVGEEINRQMPPPPPPQPPASFFHNPQLRPYPPRAPGFSSQYQNQVQQQSLNPTDIQATTGYMGTSRGASMEDDKTEQNDTEGQFTLFGSENFLKYAKWSSGTDDYQ